MRWPPVLPALLLAPALLGACAPRYVARTPLTPPLNLDGPAPDVVIFAVSGRCAVPCAAPRDNWDYLTGRGTTDRLAQAIAAQGFTVQTAGYAAHPGYAFKSPYIGAEQRGYAALRADYQRLRDTWMRSARPPRVVLLGHSQGSAWLHFLTRVNSGVPVALQVDLDGLCATWSSDFRAALSATDWPTWNEPSPLSACDREAVVGRSLQGKDIVWPNVAADLEVQSKRLPARTSASGGFPVNYLFDLTPNVRLDGSRAGIQTFVSRREDHSAVSYPNSDAAAWVAEEAGKIAATWKTP